MKLKIFIGLFVLLGVVVCLPVDAKDTVQTPVLPSVIEVIGRVGEGISPSRLKSFCKAHHIPTSSIYIWKNHLAIYGQFGKQNRAFQQIKSLFSRAEVKCYKSPFYVFDRKYCPDSTRVKEWTNILLTANLVNDTLLQKEYMQYHATQFQEWPEVSNGFCNADFQQLLVFRNGRQLMLVISIPKGKNLDELNPKTTENNHRVDEWNRRMAKYQEGLSGTAPGEVWVFLQPVSGK